MSDARKALERWASDMSAAEEEYADAMRDALDRLDILEAEYEELQACISRNADVVGMAIRDRAMNERMREALEDEIAVQLAKEAAQIFEEKFKHHYCVKVLDSILAKATGADDE